MKKNLEKVICELDSKTKQPKHAIIIPEEKKTPELPNFYCHDSRIRDCEHGVIHKNKSYCNYHVKYN